MMAGRVHSRSRMSADEIIHHDYCIHDDSSMLTRCFSILLDISDAGRVFGALVGRANIANGPYTEIALSKGTALSMPYRASIPKRRVNRGRESRPIHRDDRPLLDSALPTFICIQISSGTDKRTRGSRRVRVSPTHRRDTTATEASWISPRNFDHVIAQFRAKTRRTKCGRDIFKGTQALRREYYRSKNHVIAKSWVIRRRRLSQVMRNARFFAIRPRNYRWTIDMFNGVSLVATERASKRLIDERDKDRYTFSWLVNRTLPCILVKWKVRYASILFNSSVYIQNKFFETLFADQFVSNLV